jgi:hypothetical protein
MTHAEAAPHTFALISPMLDAFARVLHGQDAQLAMIAGTQLALALITNAIAHTPSANTLKVQAGMDTLDAMLAAFYDRYEDSLARETRQ